MHPRRFLLPFYDTLTVASCASVSASVLPKPCQTVRTGVDLAISCCRITQQPQKAEKSLVLGLNRKKSLMGARTGAAIGVFFVRFEPLLHRFDAFKEEFDASPALRIGAQ
jgi:hypothetical protein